MKPNEDNNIIREYRNITVYICDLVRDGKKVGDCICNDEGEQDHIHIEIMHFRGRGWNTRAIVYIGNELATNEDGNRLYVGDIKKKLKKKRLLRNSSSNCYWTWDKKKGHAIKRIHRLLLLIEKAYNVKFISYSGE